MTRPSTMSRREAGTGLPLLLLAFVLGLLVAAGLVLFLTARRHAGDGAQGPVPGAQGGAAARGTLPVLWDAPAFALTERSGRPLSRADLEGRVWVANFIFTRCTTICPELTRKMAAIRTRLALSGAGDVLSVSFSVDPANDTPDVLTRFAARFEADPTAWFFVTGETATVLRVVNEGFHMMMSDPGKEAPAHTNRFLVIDRKGRVRSMHEGTDTDVVDTIVEEALDLRKEVQG